MMQYSSAIKYLVNDLFKCVYYDPNTFQYVSDMVQSVLSISRFDIPEGKKCFTFRKKKKREYVKKFRQLDLLFSLNIGN